MPSTTIEARIFRHTLHNLVNRATSEQTLYALNDDQSPLRTSFVKFLAFAFADWLAEQPNVDQKKVEYDWAVAFTPVPPSEPIPPEASPAKEPQNIPSPSSSRDEGQAPVVRPSQSAEPDSSDSSDDDAQDNITPGGGVDSNSVRATQVFDPDKHFMTGKGWRIKMIEKDVNRHFRPIFDSVPLSATIRPEATPRPLHPHKRRLIESQLPSLAETPTDERADLLCEKLELCLVICDFTSNEVNEIHAVAKKKAILTEILEHIARFSWYTEPVLRKFLEMISLNLFRSLPSKTAAEKEQTDPYEDKSWPHLELVYDLTLRLVICTDVEKKVMKRHLQGSFVDSIIELFASEDHREREYLKTILHRIYGRFMPLRTKIRTSIANCCYRAIYSPTASVNGIAEFLEIFCSIIHGFSTPVKEQHKEFLRNVLVPLHKCVKLQHFHEQLVACVVQFVFKDPSVVGVILGGLLRFWPKQSPMKEEMFLTEVVSIMAALVTNPSSFNYHENKVVFLSIVDQILECMTSAQHQVAERALATWMEEGMTKLIAQDHHEMFPRLVAAFESNKSHWHEFVRQSNEEVLEHVKALDPNTWEVYQLKILEACHDLDQARPPVSLIVRKATGAQIKPDNRAVRAAKWELLKRAAANRRPAIERKVNGFASAVERKEEDDSKAAAHAGWQPFSERQEFVEIQRQMDTAVQPLLRLKTMLQLDEDSEAVQQYRRNEASLRSTIEDMKEQIARDLQRCGANERERRQIRSFVSDRLEELEIPRGEAIYQRAGQSHRSSEAIRGWEYQLRRLKRVIKGIRRNKPQPMDDIVRWYPEIIVTQNRLHRLAKRLANDTRCDSIGLTDSGPKTLYRIVEKMCLHSKLRETWVPDIWDVCRVMISYDHLADVTEAFQKLRTPSYAREVKVVNCRCRFTVENDSAWQDFIVHVVFANSSGVICEIQFSLLDYTRKRKELTEKNAYSAYRAALEVERLFKQED